MKKIAIIGGGISGLYFANILNNQNHKVIFTFPNADEGFREFIKIIKIKLKKTNSLIVPNLGLEHTTYLRELY